MKGLFLVLFSILNFIAFSQGKSSMAKPSAALSASVARGKIVYTNFCLACHQADGYGVPNLNPPLVKTPGVMGAKPYLINLILKGSRGQVEIEGETFNNAMPPQTYLTDAQIADVLTYIRNSFGNQQSAVTPLEVKAARAKLK